ncbi:uncharacterized protein MONBRDRAFT_32497 [Monosiga brevicollis MX1]|uniref:Uncharacterized protein n=1 Tax=Monosiga brevicollis TaxID=81824 RepID=A9V0N0_MONBE|nr:uncharacterized protein MONBRDRAFT_32497 [Monosiga brevicollis MX1]EDQ89046.1 predicted protein [Monosiga brevicollis MX1]|eukprot:XP_001746151.1 hypothetical protein [Monosiga brevicollis MX1]
MVNGGPCDKITVQHKEALPPSILKTDVPRAPYTRSPRSQLSLIRQATGHVGHVSFDLPHEPADDKATREQMSRSMFSKGTIFRSLISNYESLCRSHKVEPLDAICEQLTRARDGDMEARRQLIIRDDDLGIRQSFWCFCDVLSCWVDLRVIVLEDCHLSDPHLRGLVNNLHARKCITELSIAGNPDVTATGLHDIALLSRHLDLLERLDLSRIPMDRAAVEQLGKGLKDANVKTLVLDQCHLDSPMLLGHLVAFVLQMPRLYKLSLCGNRMGRGCASMLAPLTQYPSRLVCLDLSNNRLKDTLGGLFQNAQPAANIRALLAQNNGVSPVGAAALFTALLRYRLRNLDLSDNFNLAVNAEGFVRLKDLLLQQNLHQLLLRNCQICAEAFVALAEGMAENMALTELDLRGSALDAASLFALERIMKTNRRLSVLMVDTISIKPDATAVEQERCNSALSLLQEHCARNRNAQDDLNVGPTSGLRRSGTLPVRRTRPINSPDIHPEVEALNTADADDGLTGAAAEVAATAAHDLRLGLNGSYVDVDAMMHTGRSPSDPPSGVATGMAASSKLHALTEEANEEEAGSEVDELDLLQGNAKQETEEIDDAKSDTNSLDEQILGDMSLDDGLVVEDGNSSKDPSLTHEIALEPLNETLCNDDDVAASPQGLLGDDTADLANVLVDEKEMHDLTLQATTSNSTGTASPELAREPETTSVPVAQTTKDEPKTNGSGHSESMLTESAQPGTD